MSLLLLSAFCLAGAAPEPPIRATVEEVVHILPNGHMEAWDMAGKRINAPKDPLPDQKPSHAAGTDTYRFIVKLAGDLAGAASSGGKTETIPHRLAVGFYESSQADDQGSLCKVSLDIPRSESAVSIGFRFARGEGEVCLDKDIHQLRLTPLQGNFKSNGKPAKAYKVEVPFVDPHKFFGQATTTFPNGNTVSVVLMQDFSDGHFNHRSSVWIVEGDGGLPTHLKVVETPWENVTTGPIPLRPKN